MSIEQTPPPYESGTIGDPLHPLAMENMRRMLLCISGPITWEVGDWVMYDSGDWTIGADEPATEGQVRELMVRAGGVAELLDCE